MEKQIDDLLKALFKVSEVSKTTYCIMENNFINTDQAKRIVREWMKANRLDALVMLRSLAKQLNQWAEQSKTGGWSTHQVEPMQNKAAEIHRFLDKAEIEKEKRAQISA